MPASRIHITVACHFLAGVIFAIPAVRADADSGEEPRRNAELRAVPAVDFKFSRPITQSGDGYSAWGTIGRLEDDSLVTVFSGGRKTHVDPWGQLRMSRSADGGLTWSPSEILHNSTIDDRDAGFLQTGKGTMIVTWFTSLAWRDNLRNARKRKPGSAGAWNPETLAEWGEAEARTTPEVIKQEWGAWALRSTDGGKTWSAPIDTLVNNPHGPASLANGQILYVGKEMWKSDRILAAVSDDDGLNWKIIGEVPVREGDSNAHYHELHAVQAADGRVIAHIRNHNAANKDETLQTESLDNGKTWSEPHPIGVVGYPSHLLKLHDGTLLMTYANRTTPFTIEVRISTDNGATWSRPAILVNRLASWDMGYPSTVQLNDGVLVTAWYENENNGVTKMQSLRWKIQ